MGIAEERINGYFLELLPRLSTYFITAWRNNAQVEIEKALKTGEKSSIEELEKIIDALDEEMKRGATTRVKN